MKIIISRKGFDSGYGGYPSPILPDGRMVSFPIPDIDKSIKYKDLYLDDRYNYMELMKSLFGDTLKHEGYGKVLVDDIGCHLDPDIQSTAYGRNKHWRGLFGQAGIAQKHLKNQGVSVGDIFLFFGWFRQTELVNGRIIYDKKDKKGKHVIYGYMEVGEIYQVNKLDTDEWMYYHPHVKRGKNATDDDVIYVAKDKLSVDNSLGGYGTLKYCDAVTLTKDGFSKSRWDLPDIFKHTSISYHSQKSWKDNYFQSAAKGQEFVLESTVEIRSWLKKLFKQAK